MASRINISSGAIWEDKVGYSRAVKVGNVVEVSGTVALQEGEIIGKNDPYLQTKRILAIISEALERAGASMTQVIRTRIYVLDISHWNEVGRAHGEIFNDIKPATSMVEVSKLIHEDCLVEIEATAILEAH